MEYKLRRMSKVFANGDLVGCGKEAKRTLICAVLLKRLHEDKYWETHGGRDTERLEQYDQEYCFKLMGKYFRQWWD